MQRVLLISGCKQSGKSSAMNYLAGYMLKQAGVRTGVPPVEKPISMFQLDPEGKLLIDWYSQNEAGEEEGIWAELDITRQDPEFADMASRVIWPIIKSYHFADLLKEISVGVFGLSREEVYGTDEEKNRHCQVKWEDIYKLCPSLKPKGKKGERIERDEYATNREFLEVFGTEICRTLNNLCWISSTFNRVVQEDYPFVVIPDCRFKEEVEFGKSIGNTEVKVVRLTRRPFESDSKAETDLLDYEGFDAIIDNVELSQEQKGEKLVEILRSWDWLV